MLWHQCVVRSSHYGEDEVCCVVFLSLVSFPRSLSLSLATVVASLCSFTHLYGGAIGSSGERDNTLWCMKKRVACFRLRCSCAAIVLCVMRWMNGEGRGEYGCGTQPVFLLSLSARPSTPPSHSRQLTCNDASAHAAVQHGDTDGNERRMKLHYNLQPSVTSNSELHSMIGQWQ